MDSSLFQTILTFNNPEEKSLLTKIIILATFIPLSANAFNLDLANILSFGKELTLYSIDTHFDASITDSF